MTVKYKGRHERKCAASGIMRNLSAADELLIAGDFVLFCFNEHLHEKKCCG